MLVYRGRTVDNAAFVDLILGTSDIFTDVAYQGLGNPLQRILAVKTQGELDQSSSKTPLVKGVPVDLSQSSGGVAFLYAMGTQPG